MVIYVATYDIEKGQPERLIVHFAKLYATQYIQATPVGQIKPITGKTVLLNFCLFQLYCCPQYERFIKFELAQRGDEAHLVDKLIDIKPHPPYGTKAARRAAKERAAERAREREMERQKAAGANPTNFYSCEWWNVGLATVGTIGISAKRLVMNPKQAYTVRHIDLYRPLD